MEQQPCRGIGVVRIDALGDCEEPYTVRTKRRYAVKTIANGTSKAIKFVNEYRVKTA